MDVPEPLRSKRRVPFTQRQRLIPKDGNAQIFITNIMTRRRIAILSSPESLY